MVATGIVDTLIAVLQVTALLVMLLGAPLMSRRVRDAITASYTARSLDRIRHGGADRAHALALAITKRFLLTSTGAVSLRKTFVLALTCTLLLLLPLYAAVSSPTGASMDAQGTIVLWDPEIPLYPALITALFSHWLLEYWLAGVLLRLLRRTPTIPLARAAVYMGLTVVCAWVLPTALAWLATYLLSRYLDVFEAVLGMLLNAPILVAIAVRAGNPASNPTFWLSLLACITFSVGLLIAAYAHVAVAVHGTNRLLAAVVSRLGPHSGTAVMGAGALVFAFLADLSSSHSLIRRVLGLP
jgi:hypothetical protein